MFSPDSGLGEFARARREATSSVTATICIAPCIIAMRMRHIAFQTVGAAFRKASVALARCASSRSARTRFAGLSYYIPVSERERERSHGFRTCLGLGQHVTRLWITRISSIPAHVIAHIVRNRGIIARDAFRVIDRFYVFADSLRSCWLWKSIIN